MVEIDKDVWASSSVKSLLKEVHSEQVAQNHILEGFDCLQRRLHNLFEKPVPMLCNLTIKKFFIILGWNFLCLALCTLPLVLSQGTIEMSRAQSFWHMPEDLLLKASLILLFLRLECICNQGLNHASDLGEL